MLNLTEEELENMTDVEIKEHNREIAFSNKMKNLEKKEH